MVLKNCSKLGIKCLINYVYDENNKEGIATGQSISEGTMISKDERIIINITNKVKTES